jgi:hypothetical protein
MSRIPRTAPLFLITKLLTGGLWSLAGQGKISSERVDRLKFVRASREPGEGSRIYSGRLISHCSKTSVVIRSPLFVIAEPLSCFCVNYMKNERLNI